MRRALGAAFQVANRALSVVGDRIICPLWDKVSSSYDFDAYEAALRADRIKRAEGL